MASASKKRRRSSLAASKIREDRSCPSPSQELYRHVKMDISNEERLEALSRLCLKFSLESVCQASNSQDVVDRLDSVKDDLYKMFDTKEYRELMKNACSRSEKLLPNPANIELDKTKEQMERKIERLQKEETAWTEFLSDIDRQAQEAEKKYEKLVQPTSEITENQKILSSKYLPELSDLNGVRRQVDTSLNKFYILLCEHEKHLDLQAEMQRKADKRLETLRNQLQEKAFPVKDSPDAIIQRLLDLPSEAEESSP